MKILFVLSIFGVIVATVAPFILKKPTIPNKEIRKIHKLIVYLCYTTIIVCVLCALWSIYYS